jgi:hypothetical protein
MNSNKEYFGEWKRESRFVCLSKDCSKRFLTVSFRKRVLQSVNHLSLQVGVRFHFERGKADLTWLPTVASLEIEGSSVRLPIKHPQTTFSAVKLRIKELRSVT